MALHRLYNLLIVNHGKATIVGFLRKYLYSFYRNRPIPTIKKLVAAKDTIDVRFSTFQNAENLSPIFLEKVKERYEGTRLGRQELEGEILEDNPGALWQREIIENTRVKEAPQLIRIVVGVDPAVSNNEGSDETGIVVVGIAANGHRYVLGDHSLRGSPNAWAMAAVKAFHVHSADRIIGEVNNGGDLVEVNIRTVGPQVPFKAVHASRGKAIRPGRGKDQGGQRVGAAAGPGGLSQYSPGRKDSIGRPGHDDRTWRIIDHEVRPA